MRFISTKVHGVLDYIMSLLLIASPWVFNFNRGGAETWVPVAVGLGGVVYTVLTNFELGLVKVLPMSVHLMIDFAMGALLIASPWLFGFHEYVSTPHIVFGVMLIGTSLVTKQVPEMSASSGDYRTI
jgi:hypothetical protein